MFFVNIIFESVSTWVLIFMVLITSCCWPLKDINGPAMCNCSAIISSLLCFNFIQAPTLEQDRKICIFLK